MRLWILLKMCVAIYVMQYNIRLYFLYLALSKAFTAVHEAQVRERQENLLCDQCPMRWFSMLCAEVEGKCVAVKLYL